MRAARERVPVRAVGRAERRRRPPSPRRRRPRPPPGRSRRAGSRAARRRGTAPRPSPRSAGSGASRAGSRRSRSSTARASSRPWPQAPAVYVLAMSVAQQWKDIGSELPDDVGARVAAARAARPRRRRPGRCSAGAGGPVPRRRRRCCSSRSPRRERSRTPKASRGFSRASRSGMLSLSTSQAAARPAAREPPRSPSPGTRRSPVCRPTGATSRRDRARLQRLHRAGGGALRPINPRRDGSRAAFSFRAAQRSATASRPAWRAAASSAATRRASAARSACCACSATPSSSRRRGRSGCPAARRSELTDALELAARIRAGEVSARELAERRSRGSRRRTRSSTSSSPTASSRRSRAEPHDGPFTRRADPRQGPERDRGRPHDVLVAARLPTTCRSRDAAVVRRHQGRGLRRARQVEHARVRHRPR